MHYYQEFRYVSSSWLWLAPGFERHWEHLRQQAGSAGQLLWKTSDKNVVRLELPDGSGAVAWKNHSCVRWWRYSFRPSMALRERRGYEVLKACGIPSPDVLACGDVRTCFYLHRCFFVTRFAEDYRMGWEFHGDSECQHPVAWRREFCERNMDYIAQFHRCGYMHGGFRTRNLLWRPKAEGGLDLLWIDVATARPLSGRQLDRARQRDLRAFFKPLGLPPAEEQALRERYDRQLRQP